MFFSLILHYLASQFCRIPTDMMHLLISVLNFFFLTASVWLLEYYIFNIKPDNFFHIFFIFIFSIAFRKRKLIYI